VDKINIINEITVDEHKDPPEYYPLQHCVFAQTKARIQPNHLRTKQPSRSICSSHFYM